MHTSEGYFNNFLTRMPSPPSVGVVIPAYNESENIAALVGAVIHELPDARVVVVDDSADDKTAQAVASVQLPNISIIHRQKKDGRGSAVIEGIRQCLAAGCETIIEMDADFSHPPEQLPALVRGLHDRGLDMLVASRYIAGSEIKNWPLSRRIFSRTANLVAKTLLRVPVADYTNGYRAYSRRAAEVIAAHCGKLGKGFIPLSEILTNVYYRGLTVGETPTHFVNRVRGESSLNGTEIKNALVGVFKIYGLKRRLLKRER